MNCLRAIALVIAAMMAIIGCADSHNVIRHRKIANPVLLPEQKIYISVSRDGVYGDEAYPGSGLTLSQILLSSFVKHVRRVDVGDIYQPYIEALETARLKGYDILIFPTILHWENHATEWNGVPDKVKVKVDVVRVDKDTLLDSIIVEGKSGLATFGGDYPQDLLPAPLEKFVSSLFQSANSAVQRTD